MVYFKKIAASEKYQDDAAIHDVIAYITRDDKTPHKLIFMSHVDPNQIADSMVALSEHYRKNSRIRLHHFILTFPPQEVQHIPAIGQTICNQIGLCYQVVAAQHEDTPNPHLHVVFNAVSHVNGFKYRGGKEDYYLLIQQMEEIVYHYCKQRVIPVVYKPQVNNPHE